MGRWRGNLTLCAGLVALGCAAKNPTAPPPLRPTGANPEAAVTSTDCQPTNPDEQSAPLRFGERSISEAAKLFDRAREEYAATDMAALPAAERAAAYMLAVETLHTALAADPYNVDATYLLASAYARTSRKQCALNLLERLLEMKHHPSRGTQVERKIDMLLGRRGTALDASFDSMRRDPNFRELISEMCRDENDADCVHGTR